MSYPIFDLLDHALATNTYYEPSDLPWPQPPPSPEGAAIPNLRVYDDGKGSLTLAMGADCPEELEAYLGIRAELRFAYCAAGRDAAGRVETYLREEMMRLVQAGYLYKNAAGYWYLCATPPAA